MEKEYIPVFLEIASSQQLWIGTDFPFVKIFDKTLRKF